MNDWTYRRHGATEFRYRFDVDKGRTIIDVVGDPRTPTMRADLSGLIDVLEHDDDCFLAWRWVPIALYALFLVAFALSILGVP